MASKQERDEDGKEVWIYTVGKHMWCGVFPGFVVVLPLIVPVCSDFDRYTFEGDRVTKFETVRVKFGGWMFFILSGPTPQPHGAMFIGKAHRLRGYDDRFPAVDPICVPTGNRTLRGWP